VLTVSDCAPAGDTERPRRCVTAWVRRRRRSRVCLGAWGSWSPSRTRRSCGSPTC